MVKDLRAELTKTKKLLAKANKELLKAKAEIAEHLEWHRDNMAELHYTRKYANAGERELQKTIRELNKKLRDYKAKQDGPKAKAYWTPISSPSPGSS